MDIKWVKEQLQAARVRKPVGNATLKLLEVFEELELEQEHHEKTIEMFSKLAMGHAHVKENKKETWVDLRPGQITVGDVVRVKADAYSGDGGKIHNGRRGKVVAVRYGDVIFKSTDGRSPNLDGAHYPPQSLEKLVELA